MVTIDIDKLRDYMTDYFGTAMFNVSPPRFSTSPTLRAWAVTSFAKKRNPSVSTFAILKLSS